MSTITETCIYKNLFIIKQNKKITPLATFGDC